MFDRYLSADGPICFTAEIPMRPVVADLPIFPPSYPAPQDSGLKGVYSIGDRGDGTQYAMLDNVPSQANRMEEVFKTPPYDLVPKASVATPTGPVNALDLNHRIADAVFKTTDHYDVIRKAILKFQANRDVDDIVRLLPTSLLFGFWDSRDTYCRWQRVVQSSIMAYDVIPQTRFSQFREQQEATRAVLATVGLDRDDLDKETSRGLQNRGLLDCPNTAALGGIMVRGKIIRNVQVYFGDIRTLRSGSDTAAAQRYLLGLALVAATAKQDPRLRQGCVLVPDKNQPAKQVEQFSDGEEVAVDLFSQREAILDYARTAAQKFLTNPITMHIEKSRAEALVDLGKNEAEKKEGNGKGKGKKAGKGKSKTSEASEEETAVVSAE